MDYHLGAQKPNFKKGNNNLLLLYTIQAELIKKNYHKRKFTS